VTALAAPGISTSPVAASCSNNDGSVLITGLSGMPPFQYSLDGGAYQGSGAFDHLSSGNHQAAVKDANGCPATQTVVIPLINTLTVDGGPDVPICEGKAAIIRAVSNGVTFSWSPATDLDNASVLQPKASPGTSTTYYLTAHDGPCQKTAPVNVVVSPAPVAGAGGVAPICYGLSTQLQGSGGVGYSWSPSDYLSDPAIANPMVSKPAQSMTYRLTVTDGNGCQSLQPAVVVVTVTPPPRLFAGNDTSILAGQSLPLHAVDVDGIGLGQWGWSPPVELDNAYVQDPLALPTQSVTYTVTASTAAGCEATASIAVKIFSVSDIFVPNAFTPNRDGHNDLLRALPVGIREFRYFAVFSRYGQRIYYTTDPSAGWNGMINGQYQPTGTYVWMSGGVDYRGVLVQRQGTVLLIR
jgi:gliding motility-associated-like protein